MFERKNMIDKTRLMRGQMSLNEGIAKFNWERTLILLSLLTLFPLCESLNFTREPTEIVTVKRGESVMFNWTVKLSSNPKEIWLNALLKYRKATHVRLDRIVTWNRNGVFLERHFTKIKGFGPFQLGTDRLLQFSSQIDNVDYKETGQFILAVSWMENNQPSRLISRVTRLVVQGKPIFCEGVPNIPLILQEHYSRNVTLSLCSLPKPCFNYKWSDMASTTSVYFAHEKDFPFYHLGNIVFRSIKRDRCGKYVTYFAKNQLGHTSYHKLHVQVLFKPMEPKNVHSYFLKDKTIVEVKWDKQESGLCNIGYQVDFLNSTKQIVHSVLGNNTLQANAHNSRSNSISAVRVIALTPQGSASVTVAVPSGPPPKEKGKQKKSNKILWISIASITGSMLLIGVIVFAGNLAIQNLRGN